MRLTYCEQSKRPSLHFHGRNHLWSLSNRVTWSYYPPTSVDTFLPHTWCPNGLVCRRSPPMLAVVGRYGKQPYQRLHPPSGAHSPMSLISFRPTLFRRTQAHHLTVWVHGPTSVASHTGYRTHLYKPAVCGSTFSATLFRPL